MYRDRLAGIRITPRLEPADPIIVLLCVVIGALAGIGAVILMGLMSGSL